MFSPVRAIIGGALVFALGGAFLIAQPFGQQAGTVAPGAEVSPAGAASAPVTGSMTWQGTDGSGMAFTEDCTADGEDCIGHASGLRYVAGYEWSDPRLPTSGEGITNFEAFGDAGLAIRSTWLLEGADGYWAGPWTGFCDPDDRCWGTVVLTGHGAYEGLSAVLVERPPDEGFGAKSMFEGGIYVGEMPAQPEPLEPSAE